MFDTVEIYKRCNKVQSQRHNMMYTKHIPNERRIQNSCEYVRCLRLAVTIATETPISDVSNSAPAKQLRFFETNKSQKLCTIISHNPFA